MYIGPKGLQEVIGDLLALNPQRIIFNPGTESEVLQEKAAAAGAEVVEACTLVMLSRGVF